MKQDAQALRRGLAGRITRLRVRAGLSQTELGRRMQDEGFSNWYQTTVSRTEKADRDPSVFEVIALARIFGTTVEAMAGTSAGPAVDYAAGLRHAVALLSRELSRAEAQSTEDAYIEFADESLDLAKESWEASREVAYRELATDSDHQEVVADKRRARKVAVSAQSGAALLTLDEAAAMLRKSPAQMRWLRHNGEGPKSAKVGGRVMYREQDLTAWINKAFEEES